jgi:hypothetical protein
MLGQSILPLYKNATKAVINDQKLYKVLAGIDLIRVGKAKEVRIALEELKKGNFMSHRENITRIKAVHNALQEMASEVVFVGGATVSLYNDRAGSDTRPTDDVDNLVEVAHYSDYAALEDKLRQK